MPAGSSVFDKLTYEKDGTIFMRPCVDISCYWAGSAFDHADGIVHFYERSLQVIGKSLTSFRTETMARASELKKDSLDLVPFWFQRTKSRRDIYMLYLESSTKEGEVSDRAFALHAIEGEGEEAGYVRLILPVGFVETDPASIVDLAKDLVADLAFDSGHGGYGLNWNTSSRYEDEARKAMGALRNRYPGLDLSDPGSTKYCAGNGIKGANWLTLISAAACEQLGGKDALAAAVGEGVIVHSLQHGVMIQAGSAPQIGDVNRRETVPIYHQVGRAVASLRCEVHPPFLNVDGVVSEGETDEWLARFDQ